MKITEKRIKDITTGDQYGTLVRARNQNRKNDYMRDIDYAGNNTRNSLNSTSGVGKPLGKNESIRNINVYDSIMKENIRGLSEATSRQSVYNIPQGYTKQSKFIVATPEKARIYKAAPARATKESLLNTHVSASVTYLPKQSYKPFNTNLKGNIEDKIKINGDSGIATM